MVIKGEWTLREKGIREGSAAMWGLGIVFPEKFVLCGAKNLSANHRWRESKGKEVIGLDTCAQIRIWSKESR